MIRSPLLQLAHRLAAAIGCAVRELPERIGWDEWVAWRAWWEIEPWGEPRADLRAAAGVTYQLAPYLPRGAELPRLLWPYWDEADGEPTPEEMKAAVEAERARWEAWEAERKAKRGGGEKGN